MFSDLTIPAIIGGALIDSVNPCAFAVLIFLLSYLLAIGSPKLILKVGLVYIATVFLVYFLAGLGILKVLTFFGIAPIIYTIAAVILIFVGLVNVKDFFWYGKGFTLAIPESKKPLIQKYIHKASIPAAIVLGFLVSAFELPCTGGIYLAVLSLLANSETQVWGVPYLLLYNFIFVLPLFIILGFVYFGFSANKMEGLREEKKKWLRLLLGLGALALGVLMLLGKI
ncbi:MAG TPA: cytochrome c biogenesis protein CcdA [Patescibacteria group bacterium]|nr:cytochrome c biogenesis protein CcdA [Patescibacteria group bacterium]